MTRAEDAARFAGIVAGARLATVAGAGHRLHAEQPERFAAAVLPFLTG
jgi:pimeloyl-ACP methyl ester carboxylesterase